ncbi:hypothetical protein [Armatimonas sp.]|uniref:hypothetical protein n=1 Tax=Armatimonas sp. TaxID=1872638 RepID=UPI00286B204C|nr:hypothetical protein [Armatimonas sp.]
MKRFVIVGMVAFSIIAAGAATKAQEGAPKSKLVTELSLTPDQKKALLVLPARPNFPDLTITRLAVTPIRVISRDTVKRTAKLRVRVQIQVRNLGSVNFESNANQQAANLNYLYDDKKFIIALPFQNIRAGATVTLVHEMDWDWMSSNEFPQGLKAELAYDPDIFIDGNTKNDDIRLTNNSKDLVGTTIHESLRRTTGITR